MPDTTTVARPRVDAPTTTLRDCIFLHFTCADDEVRPAEILLAAIRTGIIASPHTHQLQTMVLITHSWGDVDLERIGADDGLDDPDTVQRSPYAMGENRIIALMKGEKYGDCKMNRLLRDLREHHDGRVHPTLASALEAAQAEAAIAAQLV